MRRRVPMPDRAPGADPGRDRQALHGTPSRSNSRREPPAKLALPAGAWIRGCLADPPCSVLVESRDRHRCTRYCRDRHSVRGRSAAASPRSDRLLEPRSRPSSRRRPSIASPAAWVGGSRPMSTALASPPPRSGSLRHRPRTRRMRSWRSRTAGMYAAKRGAPLTSALPTA
jgi:hypothetical protein